MASSDYPHTKPVHEVLEYYKVREDEGLSNDKILEQRKKYSYNGEFCKTWYFSSVEVEFFFCFFFVIVVVVVENGAPGFWRFVLINAHSAMWYFYEFIR